MGRTWFIGNTNKGHFEIVLVIRKWSFKFILMYMKGEPNYELYDVLFVKIGRVL